jgi:1,4-alpha-glucan branching enzyme
MTTTAAEPAQTQAGSKEMGNIELALFAPYNETVQLIGSWNNWEPIKGQRGDDGWWRFEVSLPDGEHQYKFRVKSTSYFCRDEMVDVFDPYALSITEDKYESSIITVKDGKRQWVDYQWKHDAVPLPANGQLVIYELHVGDFKGGGEHGHFSDVIDKLDHIAKLGINCVELMPVKEFPGTGWGYSLRSLFGVENSYGKPEDLARLVDECHGRGIRVIIDGVYNHADKECPLAKIAYEYWFYKDNPDPPEMQWGPKYNYSHYDKNLDVFPARKYVIDSIQFWVEKFHIDGIRFDATRAIKDFAVMRELADAAYSKINGAKHFWTVAEHIPEDPAIAGRERGAPMDAAWFDSLGRHLQAVVSCTEQAGNQPEDLDGLIKKFNPCTNGYEKPDRMVNFIGNHDYKRAMTIIGEDGKIFEDAAFRRMKLGTALLLTIPGIPMIWMGQEFGFASDKSLDPRPLDWDLLKNENNADLLAFHQGLVKLRTSTPALQGETFEVIFKDDDRKIFAFKRWNGEGNVIVVVVNLKDQFEGEVKIQGPFLEDGVWHEFFRNYDVKVTGGQLVDKMGESEVKIFIRK